MLLEKIIKANSHRYTLGALKVFIVLYQIWPWGQGSMYRRSLVFPFWSWKHENIIRSKRVVVREELLSVLANQPPTEAWLWASLFLVLFLVITPYLLHGRSKEDGLWYLQLTGGLSNTWIIFGSNKLAQLLGCFYKLLEPFEIKHLTGDFVRTASCCSLN